MMAWYVPDSDFVDRELPVILNRPFTLNSMVSTHAQLLLRSGKLGKYDDRVDLVFKDVRAMRIFREFPTLHLRQATDDEDAEIRGEVPADLMRGASGYIIEASPKFAYVVAGSALMAID